MQIVVQSFHLAGVQLLYKDFFVWNLNFSNIGEFSLETFSPQKVFVCFLSISVWAQCGNSPSEVHPLSSRWSTSWFLRNLRREFLFEQTKRFRIRELSSRKCNNRIGRETFWGTPNLRILDQSKTSGLLQWRWQPDFRKRQLRSILGYIQLQVAHMVTPTVSVGSVSTWHLDDALSTPTD